MKNRDLVIFGAGDLAREVEFLVRELNRTGEGWNLLGYVVEDTALFGKRVGDYPIIEGVEALKRQRFDGAAVIAVGSPAVGYKIKNQINAAGLDVIFPNLVHQSVVVDRESLLLGKGAIICAGCVLTVGIKLGDFTYMNMGCTLGHDVETGTHCILNPQANINGRVILEDYTYIGANAVIMQQKRIGRGAQVSMGSVVCSDVAPWVVVGGNPSRIIKKLESWG